MTWSSEEIRKEAARCGVSENLIGTMMQYTPAGADSIASAICTASKLLPEDKPSTVLAGIDIAYSVVESSQGQQAAYALLLACFGRHTHVVAPWFARSRADRAISAHLIN
jgi:hypothetical protein